MMYWALCSFVIFLPTFANMILPDHGYVEGEESGSSASTHSRLVKVSTLGISLYPIGLLACFTTAWYYNKKFYFKELSNTGYIEKLLTTEENLKNFKEVIRKEV